MAQTANAVEAPRAAKLAFWTLTSLAIVLSSAGLWGFFLLIEQGVKEAAAINRVVTVAKLILIGVFVILALFFFEPAVFASVTIVSYGIMPIPILLAALFAIKVAAGWISI